MKVLFPRNIDKGLLSGLNFRFGPFQVSLFQLILLAIGAAGMLGVVNTLLKSGFNKVIAIALASPILLIFMIVAFFEVSELALVPFLCKMLRSHVFDVTKKFQCFFPKTSEERLMLQKRQYTEKTEEIHYKTNTIDKELLEKMESGGLL